MKIVLFSDIHANQTTHIPPCDILIFCGDFSYQGRIEETIAFLNWFEQQPAKHRIFISGNHDFLGYQNPGLFRSLVKERKNIYYLEDSGIEIKGLKIWGLPWTPIFNEWAFMLADESPAMEQRMSVIPTGLDLLISHGPPYGVLDRTVDGEFAGGKSLTQAILDKKPKYVVCGHIHEAYGTSVLGDSIIINCSVLNERYYMVNIPVIITLP
jgi:Icc-related predicted phosphoesterase